MYEEYLEFAKDIAMYAKEVMLKYYHQDNQSHYKSDATIVTKADKEINHYLIERVKSTYPDHSVDGEEEQFNKSRYVWVCDPVDGTAMYARHIPVAVFSLAFVVDGEPKAGVVYDPFNDDLYTAIKGKGAYVNGQPIHVNNCHIGDQESISDFELWSRAEYKLYGALKEIAEKEYMMAIGSCIHACMLVASGNFTSVVFPGTVHKNCDIAAAKVIVEEAGGKVTNFFNEEQRYDQDIQGAVISNGIVHDELITLIDKYIK